VRGAEGGERLIGVSLYDDLQVAVAAATSLRAQQDVACYVRAIPHAFQPALQRYLPQWQQSYVCWSGPTA
jgi:hypothetical protein